MNRLVLTWILSSLGVLSILVPALAESPTPSTTRMSDAEYEKAQRITGRWAAELLSVRNDTSDPSLDDHITISKRDWQIMQAKVNLLMRPSYSWRLSYNLFGHPAGFTAAEETVVQGFWFWNFTTTDPDEKSLAGDALMNLEVVARALPDTHVNAHCFVVFMLGRNGKIKKRYITFDSDEIGKLLPPHISISPLRMSVTRRKEIASIFQARASLAKELDECLESLSGIRGSDQMSKRIEKCDELSERYKLVDRMIPGTGGLYELIKEANARQ